MIGRAMSMVTAVLVVPRRWTLTMQMIPICPPE